MGGRNRERLDAAAAAVGGASAFVVDAEDPASLADFFRAAGLIDDLVITITRRGHRESRDAEHLGEADLAGSFAGKTIATLRPIGHALPSLSEHGSITRLGTFLSAQGLPGGVESMAMWQDTAHASAGAQHTTALFARYDDEVIEVTRTEDSFGSVGQQSPATKAYFDGFIDGYQSVDPQLSHVEELWRERLDGQTEFVARFWYLPKG
jgi:hypothetical protein